MLHSIMSDPPSVDPDPRPPINPVDPPPPADLPASFTEEQRWLGELLARSHAPGDIVVPVSSGECYDIIDVHMHMENCICTCVCMQLPVWQAVHSLVVVMS